MGQFCLLMYGFLQVSNLLGNGTLYGVCIHTYVSFVKHIIGKLCRLWIRVYVSFVKLVGEPCLVQKKR